MGDSRPRTIRLDDLIFKATDALLIGPDYTAIMQICDVLNNRKERVPLAVGVFKERLKHREKDVVLRTLELLDAVTKNVPESLQYVGSKDFLSVLRKMVANKKTEFLVKETTLSYIQSCALAFKHKSGIHFYETYEALRKEGVSFPPPETEATQLFKATSPVHSPQVPLDRHQQQDQQKQTWAEQAAALAGAHTKTSQGSRKKTTDGGRRATREEKLVLAFSSSGLAGLEQELSLLQNSIDLAEEILRNARSKTELQSNDVFAQVFSACQIALPQVQTLLAVPSPPMTEDMVAALLFTNDRLLAAQSLHQGLITGRATDPPVSDEEEDSSEEEFAGVLAKSTRVVQPSQTDSAFSMLAQRGAQHRAQQQQQQQQREEEIPPLLRAPPRARSTSSSTPAQLLPTATSHRPQPTGAAAGQTNLLGSPSPSTDDLLDEFAALALRHQQQQQQSLASPFTALATPPVLSAALLPPQPYAMPFPGYAPAPTALLHHHQQPSPSVSNQAFPLSPPPYGGGGGGGGMGSYAMFPPAASTASPTAAAPNPFLSGGSAPFASEGTGLPAYSSSPLLPAASATSLAGSSTYPPPSASGAPGVFYPASSQLSSASASPAPTVPPYHAQAAITHHGAQPPAAWGAAPHTGPHPGATPQAASVPAATSLQDDFDLLFGKRQ